MKLFFKSLKIILIFTNVFSLATAFAAKDSDNKASSTTHILQSASHSAAVMVEPSQNRVTVQLKQPDDVSPGAVHLTFFDKNNRPLVVELKALPAPDASHSDFSTYTGSMPTFNSASGGPGLSASQQSFVGIELSVPLSKGGVDTLRRKLE